jgi:hypothetical protein
MAMQKGDETFDYRAFLEDGLQKLFQLAIDKGQSEVDIAVHLSVLTDTLLLRVGAKVILDNEHRKAMRDGHR